MRVTNVRVGVPAAQAEFVRKDFGGAYSTPEVVSMAAFSTDLKGLYLPNRAGALWEMCNAADCGPLFQTPLSHTQAIAFNTPGA